MDILAMSVTQEDELRAAGFSFLRIFMLHAPRAVLEKRLHYRRIDPEEDKIYNLLYVPPVSITSTFGPPPHRYLPSSP